MCTEKAGTRLSLWPPKESFSPKISERFRCKSNWTYWFRLKSGGHTELHFNTVLL